MDVHRAADEAHGGHTEAAAVHHFLRRLDEARMIGQTQIVVGAEVENFLTLHLNGCTLRALDDALLLVQTGFLQVGQCFAEMFLNLTVHDFEIIIYLSYQIFLNAK